MKHNPICTHRVDGARLLSALAAAVLVLAAVSITAATWAKEKMKPEELVAKHLESIGTAEARAAISSRVITGTCLVTYRVGGGGQLQGTARIASEDVKNLMIMEFGHLEYPHEKMGFDGKNSTVGQLRPGIRSPLARFFHTHSMPFSQGLMGGTLSSAWPLLDLAKRNPRLNYAGLKKVDNRQLHELKYRPRKDSADVQVSLFFEDETFRHVRSHYRLVRSAEMGRTPEESARQREDRYQVVEEFSDFRPEGQLTLPHQYKLHFSQEEQNRTILSDWMFNLTGFAFNQPIDPADFNVAK